MNQAAFKSQAVTLTRVLRGVTGRSSLLREACRGLAADVAILLRVSSSQGEQAAHEIVGAHPPEYCERFRGHVQEMRGWYADFVPSPDGFPGYARETPEESLRLEEENFADALVAFSERRIPEVFPQEDKSTGMTSGSNLAVQPRYELMLLKHETDSPYGSYDCWTAAAMLRQFELYEQRDTLQQALLEKTQKQVLEEEARKEQYAGYMTNLVIPWESWEELKARMKELNPDVRGPNYVIWTSYRLRFETGSFSPANQELERVREQPPLRSVAPDILLHIEETAGDLTRIDPSEGKLCSDLLVSIARFLLSGSPAFSPGGKDNENPVDSRSGEAASVEKLILMVFRSGPEEKRLGRFSELQVRQLISIYLERSWWNLLESLFAKAPIEKPRPSESISEGIGKSNAKLGQTMASVTTLLNLTSALAVKELVQPQTEHPEGGDKRVAAGQDCGQSGFLDMGRENLRLYFGTLLAGAASKIHQLFLGQPQRDELRNAPPEQKRAFIASICRFMLSIVRIVQKRRKLFTRPYVVSPYEELDALLHLIDRYAHVELEVPEILNVRDHLTRQITAEVGNYLGNSRYRDHLLHVIDVFLLGHLLLNTDLCWLEGKELKLVEHFTRLARPVDGTTGVMPENDWLRNWAVASLFHDIGYQLIDKKKLIELEAWDRYFRLEGKPCRTWLDLQRNVMNSQEWSALPGHGLSELFQTLLDQPLKPFGCKECFPTNVVDFRDHGILSALRVSQVLVHAGMEHPPGPGPDSAPLLASFRHAIHAIAHHNLFDGKVSLDSHPLSCLLRICDELQEWDRYRVNIEKVLKNLYLDLQHLGPGEYSGNSMLAVFKANIVFEPCISQESLPICVGARLLGREPRFHVLLQYRDPSEADFDTAMTMLSKAYNLQHIDMTVATEGQKDLRFCLELCFPSPRKYGDCSEYDIYGLFTEEFRSLPLLRSFSSVEAAENGLVRLQAQSGGLVDRYAIVIGRSVGPGNRHGWLPVNPDIFFDDFQAFKKNFLRRISR
jgi:hypothetical protein